MPSQLASFPRNLRPWWEDPTSRRTLGVLGLTTALAVICGGIQLMALGQVAMLLPLALLLAAGYLLLALSRKLAALGLYVLAFSEFLGLVHESFEVGGVKLIDIITAIVAVPLVLHLLKAGFPFRGPAARRLRLGALILFVLLAGEVILTVLGSGQGFWLSVKAAKPYLYYFAFLLVPVYAGSPEKVRRLAGWMTATASALALMYLFISLTGDSPSLPGLIVGEASFIGLGTFTRVRSNGASLMVAMLLYQFYRYADGRSSRFGKLALIVLAMGAVVHFYRSLWIGVLAGIIAQASIEGKRGARTVGKFLIGLVVLSIGLGAILPEYGRMILSRALSTVTEVEELSGSYGVRYEQIESWAPILREHWLVGIGFLHHDSVLGQRMEALHKLEGTGNYDIGWVDLLGRLGTLGVVLLGWSLYLLSKGGWYSSSYRGGGETAILRRTLVAWLVVGVVSLPGYPLLSCGAGIFPLALLAGMLAVLEDQEKAGPSMAGGEKPAGGEFQRLGRSRHSEE